MRVLIISGTFLPMNSSPLRMAPSGAAYIAGAAREAGHTVDTYDCYIAHKPEEELKKKIGQFNPDVVGLSITIVTSDAQDEKSELGTRYFDMRPRIKELVDVIKKNSNARIIPGGPGFNYYSEQWLRYLDLDYGIRGEGEFAFPLFLEKMENGEDISAVPGAVLRDHSDKTTFCKRSRDHVRNFDDTAMPAYNLFDFNSYITHDIPFALFTKRGCAFGCTFCPHSSLEGTRYRLKSAKRVVDEIVHVGETTGSLHINFCDNSFNCPKPHAEAICREIIDRGLEVTWLSGSFKPLGVTRDFCRLIGDSGCEYVGLSIESASDTMLNNMKRGYTVADVRDALDNLSHSGIPFGLSILLGGPGETPDTITETFQVVDQYPTIQSTWVNIGLFLWTHHQKILEDARRDGQLKIDTELFDGGYYISPQLSKNHMIDLIDALRSRPKTTVQVNMPYSDYLKDVNVIGL